MFRKITENKYFPIALSALVLIVFIGASCILAGLTDAYFTDNDGGSVEGSSGKLGIMIEEIESSFADSVETVESISWGSSADLSFQIKNTENMASDVNTSITVNTTSDSITLTDLAKSFEIYAKNDVTEVDGIYVPNKGATPIGVKIVTDNGIEIALQKETLSGNADKTDSQVKWESSSGVVISDAVYKNLSESEKTAYTKCDDVVEYDLVFIFNDEQNVSVDLVIDVNTDATKHGNDGGWKSSDGFTKYGSLEAKTYDYILQPGPDFNKNIADDTTKILFTDIVIPTDVTTVDVSEVQDGSILAWNEGEMMYVSSVDGGTIYANPNCEDMFYNKASLQEIEFVNFNTSKTTTMQNMFYNCTALTSLDVTMFNDDDSTTKNVTTMKNMFCDCSALVTLDVSNLNTENTTNMNSMFNGCEKLATLDVSSFVTSNVKDMTAMFCDCNALTELDVSNFNTSNATNMKMMFRRCINLTSLDLSGFNTSNVENMSDMFYYCSQLKSIDLSSFNTSQVKNMSYMFYNCLRLPELNVSHFNTSNVNDMSSMFDYCKVLTSLDVSNFDTSNVTKMGSMFYYCSQLKSIDLSRWKTSKVKDMSKMFYFCTGLSELNLMSFEVDSLTNTNTMFYKCSNLVTIYATEWSAISDAVTNYTNMFSGCTKLVGAVAYDSSKVGFEMANTKTGYFTTPLSFSLRPSVDEDLETHEHVYNSITVEPTCEEDGYITYTCDCGNTYTVIDEGATKHNWVEWSIEYPTCTDSGTTTYICLNCMSTCDEITDPLGHSYEEHVMDNGETAMICKECGDPK